jgi:hypothetical protein
MDHLYRPDDSASTGPIVSSATYCGEQAARTEAIATWVTPELIISRMSERVVKSSWVVARLQLGPEV